MSPIVSDIDNIRTDAAAENAITTPAATRRRAAPRVED